MVFYRKYRPQNIEELDSKSVREKLVSVLSKDDTHAMLFTGPKGLGKTSTARIVAKILNCEKLTEKDRKAGKLTPCNKCDQCISITNGSNIDVLEIDGASNRGIDEIRDLREKIKLSAARANKKVYIIDEVHMLTTEAFNALLKTLEEPPSHVVFILCTTEPHKVPATIASRCFQITFKKATDEELLRAFARISKAEKIDADKDAFTEIAKFADGSFRDGVKVLEELSAVARGKKITKEFVQKTYQIGDIDKNIDEMVESLVNKDVKGGINLVGNLVEQGIDMKYFMETLIGGLHKILLEKVGVSKPSSKFTERIELQDLKKLIELLSEATGKIKFSVLPQLPLEIVIIEWAVKDSSDAEVVHKNFHTHNAGELGLKNPKAVGANVISENFVDSPHQNMLQELIDKVKIENQPVAGFLRGCAVSDFKNGALILEAKFQFHKDKLEDPKAKEIIEDALKEITGKSTKVSFVLKSI
ncbi:MAG: DNA polymerase III subunit gamma/tau [Patescibacteria group bacterium]